MKIAILCDGDFPTHSYPIKVLTEADILICCDGSIMQLLNSRISKLPQYIVGDMDTLSLELKNEYSDIIIESNCQESNDQTEAYSFALGLLKNDQQNKISFLGATGRREDHTFGNISLLSDYAVEGACIPPFHSIVPSHLELELITDYGMFKPYFDTFTAPSRIGEQISIFSFDNSLNIKSEGLLYKTDNVVFDLWWKATLNEATEDKFTLTFSHKSRVLVFYKY